MSLWTTSPRYDSPGFSSLFRMLDDFEKHTQDSIGRQGGRTNTFNPKFDVTEHEKNYVLQGELPGIPPENVIVEFTDSQTMVIRGHAERTHTEGDPSLARVEGGKEPAKIEASGGQQQTQQTPASAKEEKKSEKPKSKPKYWLSERSYGEFSRVFNFPEGVDQDNVTAKFEHGVLNITVPKVAKQGAKKIEIK